MKRKLLFLSIIAFLLSIPGSKACSSFMLKSKSELVFGHNLDISGNMPGIIFINKRGTLKTGYTWAQLTSLEKPSSSNVNWVSKYGSVTFNAFGRELPDGGMNENGLFIWEMTGGSTFDTIKERPRLFMSQWIQYQLDNYASLDEVLENLPSIGLDGWNWQFFVADREGSTAAIEFIEGIPIVHKNNDMPIPMMGNGRYSDEMLILKEFEGFGGEIKVDPADPNLPGMVKAAKMMKVFDESSNAIDYGFGMLEQLGGKVSKWAVIFDVKNMKCYFRTAQFPEVKSFSISSMDFTSNTPVEILNMQDTSLTNDVGNNFIAFNEDDNYDLVREIVAKIYHADEFEISESELVSRLATIYIVPETDFISDVEGIWTGYAMYPTTGEPAKVDWKLHIWEQDGTLHGKITDSAGLFSETDMYNTSFENGIFRFTTYAYGYVFIISAGVDNDGIKGIINFSDETRKGNFFVQLN